MIWQMMLYATGVAAALSLMGYCEERLALLRDLPRRWVWPLTMVLSVAWVVVAMLWTSPAAVATPELELAVTAPRELGAVPVENPVAPLAVTSTADEAATSNPWGPPSDRTLLAAWAGTSALLLLAFFLANALLQKRSARWRRTRVLGREVMVSESIGPALMGAWRPRMVVPEWFMAETPEKQELILQHEEQHIAARDPLLLRAATLFTIALPWNLPLWWQLLRMRQAIELDCDARVLRNGASPMEYGSVLLAVTRRGANVPAGLIAMSAPVSALERRIRHFVPDASRRSMWRTGATLLLWIVGVGAAMGLEAPPLPQREAPDALATGGTQELAGARPVDAMSAVPAGFPAPRQGAADLPRLLPRKFVAPPDRREILERAIVEQHPELVTGAERDGVAFVSVQLRPDGSVANSALRYVEASDTAGLDAAMRTAFEPFQGQLLLARGWQIADGATVKSQIRVSYRTIQEAAVIREQQQAWASEYADVQRVVEHYLPGAMTDPDTLDKGTPYLIVSGDGRVLTSGYLAADATRATLTRLQGVMPGQRVTSFAIMRRPTSPSARNPSGATLVIGWVQP